MYQSSICSRSSELTGVLTAEEFGGAVDEGSGDTATADVQISEHLPKICLFP
jgi:hypothetical protein